MSHLVDQFVFGTAGAGNLVDHADTDVSILVRSYNKSAPNLSIAKGTWGKFYRMITVSNTTGDVTFDKKVTAASFVKEGGTASQFLKADGSVDGRTFLTSHQSLAGYATQAWVNSQGFLKSSTLDGTSLKIGSTDTVCEANYNVKNGDTLSHAVSQIDCKVDALDFRLSDAVNNGATSVAKSGNGELVAGLSKYKNVITYSMGFATKLYTHDLRDDKPNSQALSIQRVATPFFMSAGNLGVGSGYYDAVYFNTYSDPSGGWTNLIALSKNPNVEYADMYIAKQANGSADWGKKVRVITDYNYTTYTVDKKGTGATGDWAIGAKYLSLQGNSFINANFLIGTQGLYSYYTSGASNYPNAYGAGIRLQRQPNTVLGDSQSLFDLYIDNGINDTLWFRKSYGVTSANSVTYGRWLKILHSENFNAYAPKLDGTGATGAWNIISKAFGTDILKAVLENGNELNFAGTSTTVDGLNLYIGYPRSGRLSPDHFYFKTGAGLGTVHARLKTDVIVDTSADSYLAWDKGYNVIVTERDDHNRYRKMSMPNFKYWFSSFNQGYTVLDLTSLDENTWYPCSVLLSKDYPTTIEIYDSLDGSTPKPGWATHNSGFTLNLKWQAFGAGWGSTDTQRSIINHYVNFTKDGVRPCGGIEQNTMASTEIVYLRGGAKYRYRCTPSGSFTVHPDGYTWSSGTYSYSSPLLASPKATPSLNYGTASMVGVRILYTTYLELNTGGYLSMKPRSVGNTYANMFDTSNAVIRTPVINTVSDGGTVQPIVTWCTNISKANGTNVGYRQYYMIGSVRGTSGYGQLRLAVGNNDAGTGGVSYNFGHDGLVTTTGNEFKYLGVYRSILPSDTNKYATFGPENSSYCHIRTNAAAGFYMEKALHVVGNVRAYEDNTFSCGESGKRWTNVYSVAMNAASNVDIGDTRLYWDSANNAIRLSGTAGGKTNLCVTGGISTLGIELNSNLTVRFDSIVASATIMAASTASAGSVVYVTSEKTFALKVGTTYYNNWPTADLYLKDWSSPRKPHTDKIYLCGDTPYVFNGTSLLASATQGWVNSQGFLKSGTDGTKLTVGSIDTYCEANYKVKNGDTLSHAISQIDCKVDALDFRLSDAVTTNTNQDITGNKTFVNGVFFQSSDLDNKAFYYNGRIAFGGITARGVNVGSLLISDAWKDVDKLEYAGLYAKGPAKVKNLVIHNTDGIAHIQFSRGGFNYFAAPESGYMAFVPGGKTLSQANSDLVITDKLVSPGANDLVWLGNGIYRWHSVCSYTLDTAGTNPYLRLCVTGKNPYWVQAFGDYLYVGNGTSKAMILDTNGNVLMGSGSVNSNWKLQVNGNSFINGNVYSVKLNVSGDATFNGSATFSGDNTFTGGNQFSGTVGFTAGNTNFVANNSYGHFLHFGNTTSPVSYWRLYGNASNGHFVIRRESMMVLNLFNNGNAELYGTLTQNKGSDIRLKKNICYGTDYAQKLLDLGRVCDYEYNDLAFELEAPDADHGRHTGLIYQKVKAVLPQMARTFRGDYGGLNYINADFINTIAGATQLNTLGLRSVLKRTETLEDKVLRLEEKVRTLERKISENAY